MDDVYDLLGGERATQVHLWDNAYCLELKQDLATPLATRPNAQRPVA